jgi:hypothetical protein
MSDFTKFEEENIILLMLESQDFFHRIMPFMKTDYFSSPELQYLMALGIDYYSKYSEVPTKEVIVNLVHKDLSTDDELTRPILSILNKELDIRNTPYIKELIISWAKKQQVSMLYNEEVMEDAKKGDLEKVMNIVDDVKKISDVIIKPYKFFDDTDSLFVTEERDYFTTGFPRLDREIHDKGPARRETLAWVGPTGVGKCHTLESKIIVDELSTIYNLEVEINGKIQIVKLAGFRKIQTTRGTIRVCDLKEGDDIQELPDAIDRGNVNM